MSDIVTVTVTDIVEHGVVCRLENGVQGFITAQHLIGKQCPSAKLYNFRYHGVYSRFITAHHLIDKE